MLTLKETAALLEILQTVQTLEAAALAFQRAFVRAEHFRVAAAVCVLIEDGLLPAAQRATALYEARAYVHWYERAGLERDDFAAAFDAVHAVVQEYDALVPYAPPPPPPPPLPLPPAADADDGALLSARARLFGHGDSVG